MKKKPRILDKDVVSVGRARGCDIILEAADVSTLHCIIFRTAEGLSIRDCGSRTGTRVNGAPVKNQPLTDEDVLHVGGFSFQVHLPPAGHDKVHQERQEIIKMREQWTAEQKESAEFFERQRQVLAEAEAALKEQRVELSRMMGDLRDFQQEIRQQQQQVDVPALLQENEQLRQIAAEWRDKAASLEERAGGSGQNAALQAELKSHATALEDLKAHLAVLESVREEAGKLRQENEQLKKWVADKDKMIADRDKQVAELQRRLERSGTASSEIIDLETYEAELTRYRQQLDGDRARLTAEMDALKLRNAELDEATKEMEMEMSRERAELARERMRLDRLRDEVRSEMDRMQRDAGVMQSLAPVHKLREELHQKKRGQLNDRLRNMRGQLQD